LPRYGIPTLAKLELGSKSHRILGIVLFVLSKNEFR
jgi:hypothetical protein